MSRVAKKPINIPQGVEVKLAGSDISVKGSKGHMNLTIHRSVEVNIDGNVISVSPRDTQKESNALAGTHRALINNMIIGTNEGFTTKLLLVGVGYKAQVQGRTVNLTLGYSHPVSYDLPEGVNAATPSNTEIVITGADKHKVGEVAAKIRSYRKPEPYKGKGVKYSNEIIRRKETKKK
jgi:large subunit ribosomal protein L6